MFAVAPSTVPLRMEQQSFPQQRPATSSATEILEEKQIGKNGEEKIVRYAKGKFLGKGGFAKCYELQDLSNMRIYAGKIIAKSSLTKQRAIQKLKTEIKIHRTLHHKHIVKFERYFEDAQNVYILLELCNAKSMMELIKKRKRLSEHEVRYYMIQIIDAVQFMHKQNVIHRDLKLGNLFLNDTHVKIGDFGLAAKLEFDGERKKTVCGTPNYIAPEILSNENGHSFEVDIWALGVIMYTLLIGTPPFETSDVQTTYQRIKDNIYCFPEDKKISDNARALIRQILNKVPEKRPSLKEILAHPFFSEGITPRHLPISALSEAPTVEQLMLGTSTSAVRSPLAEKTRSIDNERNQYANLATNQLNTNVLGKRETTTSVGITSPSRLEQKAKMMRLLVEANMQNDIRTRLTKTHLNSENESPDQPEIQATQKTLSQPSSAQLIYTRSATSSQISQKENSAPQATTTTVTQSTRTTSSVQYPFGSSSNNTQPSIGNNTTTPQARPEPDQDDSDRQALEAMHRTLVDNLENTASIKPRSSMVMPDWNPSGWVAKWVDYSNKYGLGYELADGTFGAFFNDSTKITLHPNQKVIEYVDVIRKSDGTKSIEKQVIQVSESGTYPQFSANLQKKITLLNYFKGYLSNYSKDAAPTQPSNTPYTGSQLYVQKWYRTKSAIIFRLSNKAVQINFFDHAKLMLSNQGQVVTYVNIQKEKMSFHISSISEQSHPELVDRLKYARDILVFWLSNKSKKTAECQ